MKKEKKNFILKNKIINSFMFNGQKETSEKILMKTLKNIQRDQTKNFKKILQLFILNLTPVFKFNKQSKKRGKKKKITFTPYLIPNNELRINFALKLLKSILSKNKQNNTENNLSREIITSVFSNKSISTEKKVEIQNQILAQKRYFYKFRW
jgi:ribosomal protein S7